jgi:hypothetical protein
MTRDEATTWQTSRLPLTTPCSLGTTSQTATGEFDPRIVFTTDGTILVSGIVVCRQDLGSPDLNDGMVQTSEALVATLSFDGGTSWQPPIVVNQTKMAFASFGTPAGNERLFGFPEGGADHEGLAAGPNDSALMTWTSGPSEALGGESHPTIGPTSSDLWFASTKDGGRTWSPQARLEEGYHVTAGSPVITHDGLWAVAYLRAPDDATLFVSAELVVATSSDGGRTWNKSVAGHAAAEPTLASTDSHEGLVVASASYDSSNDTRTPFVAWSHDGGAQWTEPAPIDYASGNTPMDTIVTDARGTTFATLFRDTTGEHNTYQYVVVPAKNGRIGASQTLDNQVEGSPYARGDYMGLAALPAGALAVWPSGPSDRVYLVAARIHLPV